MNKIIKYSSFLGVACIISMHCTAGGFREMKDTSRFIRQLNAMTNSLKTIESDFVQEKNMAMLEEKIISKGTFCFKKTGMIRWQYNEPYTYLVIINNNKVLIKDENKINKFDMKSNKVFRKVNELLTDCMQGTVLSKRTEYRVSFYENESFFIVKLLPLSKNMKEFIWNILIYFDKKDFSVSKIDMVEPSGDNTLISFKNKKINQPVADEKFIIK